MSATTSSEEKIHYDRMAHDSDTIEENESAQIEQNSEPRRKKPRTSSVDPARSKSLSRPPKYKGTDTESRQGYNSAGPSRMRTPSSREPSRSRSDRSRSKSPSVSIPPARVGKRVRRKPQRWDGDRPDVVRSIRIATANTAKKEAAEAKHNDAESTVSIDSNLSVSEEPQVDSPIIALQKARISCGEMPSRREIVDSFHSWQLRIVSQQAAQQKALHVFLKRRLRKRISRAPDYDRMEDEALRSCRNPGSTKVEKQEEENVSGEQVWDETNVVPSKIRLPLEAYLPRRARATTRTVSVREILEKMPLPPQYPKDLSTENGDGNQQLILPTVGMGSGTKINSDRNQHAEKTGDMNSKDTSGDIGVTN